jgi:hypothetical protein
MGGCSAKFSFPFSRFLGFRFPKGYQTLAEGILNTSIDTSKKNNNIKTHPANHLLAG